MELLQGTHTQTLTEKILAVRNPEAGEDRWEFSELEVSGFFTFCLTDVWHLRVQADYYDAFWEPVLTDLKNHDKPVEIHVTCEYTYGNESEETLKSYMRAWTEKVPGFMAIREPDESDGVPSFVHMHTTGMEVVPLEIGELDGDE